MRLATWLGGLFSIWLGQWLASGSWSRVVTLELLASWPRVVVRTFDSVSVASRSFCRERRGGRAENARTRALTLTLN